MHTFKVGDLIVGIEKHNAGERYIVTQTDGHKLWARAEDGNTPHRLFPPYYRAGREDEL